MPKDYHYKKGYQKHVRARHASVSDSPLVSIKNKVLGCVRAVPALLAVPVLCAAVAFALFTQNPVSGAAVREMPVENAAAPQSEVVLFTGARKITELTTLPEAVAAVPEDAVAVEILGEKTEEMVEAIGLYVDDALVTVAMNEEEIRRVLDAYMKSCAQLPLAEISFAQDVKTLVGLFPADRVADASVLESLLAEGELSLDICEVVEEVHQAPIAFETEITYDEDEYEDYTHIARSGVEGVANVTDRVVYVNGKEVERSEVSSVQYTAPVTELITVGTMVRPDGSTPGEASGSFCWPTPTLSIITTYYEMRWGSFHGALDISGYNCTGEPIVAADAGVVTFAGYKSNGYGYHVIIDHGNGFETMYAHCCDVYVNTGDLVAKGEVIGGVGNTGYSTGAHLHFEILCNGEKVNPLNYVAY